ncbi:hypothetical protein CC2G_012314 [Coprinopsis cinerea AmutBmut pab1-1]|nr:hypothetical protein CC2G_012314 [Coprinopsis cinerea AmutBmut pab1-1]
MNIPGPNPRPVLIPSVHHSLNPIGHHTRSPPPPTSPFQVVVISSFFGLEAFAAPKAVREISGHTQQQQFGKDDRRVQVFALCPCSAMWFTELASLVHAFGHERSCASRGDLLARWVSCSCSDWLGMIDSEV